MALMDGIQHSRTFFQEIESNRLVDKISKYLVGKEEEYAFSGLIFSYAGKALIELVNDTPLTKSILLDINDREYWNFKLPQKMVTIRTDKEKENTECNGGEKYIKRRLSQSMDSEIFGRYLRFLLRSDGGSLFNSDCETTSFYIYDAEKIDELLGVFSDYKTELISFIPKGYPKTPKIVMPSLIEKIQSAERKFAYQDPFKGI